MFKYARYLLFISVVCVAFTACNDMRTPSDTAKNFVNALYSGDKAIIDYIYFPTELNYTKREIRAIKEVYAIIIERMRDEVLQDGEIDSVEVVDEAIIGNKALVEVKIIHKDGTVDEESFELIKIDKQWKIAGSYPFD